jgi:hypothetical protein
MKNRASHLQNNSWQGKGISVSCFQIFFIEGKKWRQDQIKDTSFNESFVEGRNRLAFVYFQLNCLWNGKLRKTTLQEDRIDRRKGSSLFLFPAITPIFHLTP